MSDAIVVGSGPNGLAGAVELARAGLRVRVLEAAETIGGGTRTSELTVPGLLHDHCSATHPMAVVSPAIGGAGLARHGLEWCWPELDLAHPLDDGSAGVLSQSIAATAQGLGEVDGRAWRRAFGGPASAYESISAELMGPMLHLPRHPLRLGRFGLPTLAPATLLARAFEGPRAKALFGGVAAHAFSRLDRPMSSAIGVALISACHASGWPVARGGSRAITDALAAELVERGGQIETGVRVGSLEEVDAADLVLLDLAPGAIDELCGERLPARVARAYRRYRHGPGAFKVDLAVEGGVPWTNEACRRAGTVHVIGGFEDLVRAEAEINRGRMPARPFVLVGQQYLADPERSAGITNPVWTYAHVPSRYPGDATDAVIDQLERFAPGLRERIVAIATRSPDELTRSNENFVGGDIVTGANTARQLVFRPRVALDPYATGIDGVYICSAATPPGAGVHGMCGYNAARSALRSLSG